MARRRNRKASAGMPVIIRYEGAGRANRFDWHLNDVVAIFPAEAGDVGNPRSMSCYSNLGQHSTCDAGYIGAKTKPATPAQKRAMLAELRKVGYKNLRVVSRASPTHSAERRRQLGRG